MEPNATWGFPFLNEMYLRSMGIFHEITDSHLQKQRAYRCITCLPMINLHTHHTLDEEADRGALYTQLEEERRATMR